MLVTKKNTKIFKIVVCLFIAATAIFLLANFVLADSLDTGINYAAGTGLSNALDIRIIIARIIRIALGFLGIIAVGLIIYAGWLWMSSAGNEEKIERAKKILQNAVIGLIIIFSAFAIVSFILNALIGAIGSESNAPNGGQSQNYGLSALGNGIIESHYPARDQKEVPRNTSIIITFREPILASTLCANPVSPAPDKPAKCDGSDIIPGKGNINNKVIRIFEKSQKAVCVTGDSPSPDCDSLAADVRVYSSNDNKIFVFAPINYLGSPTEYIDYTVYLGKGLLRQTTELAFPGIEKDYGWSFEVSNKIDLKPPQVKREGVFPAPDNAKDTVVAVSSAAPAIGSITVNSNPSIYSDARVSVTGKSTDSPTAGAEIDKACQQDGNFMIDIKTGLITSLYKFNTQDNKYDIGMGQGVIGIKSGGKKQVIFSECNLALTLANVGDNFTAGNSWNLTLIKATAADILTVGDTTYIASNAESGFNFKVWPTREATAQSLVHVLADNSQAARLHALNSNVITIMAITAGVAGNNINLSSSNPAALEISPMADGTDKADRVNINGKKDQPMNAVIQVVFDEAIMPLTVSGTSEEVKDFIRVVNANDHPVAEGGACTTDADCKSFVCTGGKCIGANEYLKGKFVVSNQYETVEFLSDKECGFNSCGEKIYCLPANSHLRVELNAASLISCEKNGQADDSLCQTYSPFNTCDDARKFCRDNGNKYYPQSDKTKPNIVDGIIDAAFNSLDGNRDNSAYGPVSYYNENIPLLTSNGDNFQWSFFISDLLDLTSPKIKTTDPAINGSEVNLIKAINISFDKLMLSSRLTTGSLTIQNGGKNILHNLLNLRSFVDQPLGYWVTNIGQQDNVGGEVNRTDVFINHTPFNQASSYKAQAGSGLKDIYQNCFLPCSSQNIAGTPSCCNGAPYDKESCP